MGMERTEIFSLETEPEVAEFCRFLLELKEVAPVSIRFTVAVTIKRAVTVVEPYDEAEESRSQIEVGFRKLVAG